MWSFIFLILGISVATTLMLYLDSRLFDKPKTKLTYAKAILMTNVITLSTIYLLSWLAPTQKLTEVIQSAGDPPKIVGAPTTFIDQIGEEMLTGDAPF